MDKTTAHAVVMSLANETGIHPNIFFKYLQRARRRGLSYPEALKALRLDHQPSKPAAHRIQHPGSQPELDDLDAKR